MNQITLFFLRKLDVGPEFRKKPEGWSLFAIGYKTNFLDEEGFWNLLNKEVDLEELLPWQKSRLYMSNCFYLAPLEGKPQRRSNPSYQPDDFDYHPSFALFDVIESEADKWMNTLIAAKLLKERQPANYRQRLIEIRSSLKDKGQRFDPRALKIDFVTLTSNNIIIKLLNRRIINMEQLDSDDGFYSISARWLRILTEDSSFGTRISRADIYPPGLQEKDYPPYEFLPHLAYENFLYLLIFPA